VFNIGIKSARFEAKNPTVRLMSRRA